MAIITVNNNFLNIKTTYRITCHHEMKTVDSLFNTFLISPYLVNCYFRKFITTINILLAITITPVNNHFINLKQLELSLYLMS